MSQPSASPQSRNSILESVASLSATGMAVLYTTHYMEEAERLCNRVGIIDHGKLIAEGTRRELVALVGERDRVVLSVTGELPAAVHALEALAWVHKVDAAADGIVLVVDDARENLPAILQKVANAGATVKAVEVSEPDLEAVFLHLTGRALRE
jgi:ABC-2 type transport system ATP-binding protein